MQLRDTDISDLLGDDIVDRRVHDDYCTVTTVVAIGIRKPLSVLMSLTNLSEPEASLGLDFKAREDV